MLLLAGRFRLSVFPVNSCIYHRNPETWPGDLRFSRCHQEEYNQKYGITPSSIVKAIRGKLVEDDEAALNNGPIDYVKLMEESKPPAKDIKKLIKELQDKMFVYAENLEFEKAAQFRDQINDLKEMLK